MPVDDAYTTFQCPECGSEFRVFGLGSALTASGSSRRGLTPTR